MASSHNISWLKKVRRLLALSVAGMGALMSAPALAETEEGLVSIDFCADQFLLGLAERNEIQAVSFEAVGPRSYYGGRAEGLPTVTGAMEEIFLLRPKLVLRTWRGGPRAKEVMDRGKIASFQPPFAFGIEGSIKQFQLVGDQIGKSEEARKLVGEKLEGLKRLRALYRSELKAVYMTPSGFTAGKGTFVNDVIKLAGFETVAEDADINYWVPLPLEKMVLSPPDFVVATFFGDTDVHVSHWSSGRHGIYKRMLGELPTIHVPSNLLSCSGAFAVEAADFIRAEASRLGLFKKKRSEP